MALLAPRPVLSSASRRRRRPVVLLAAGVLVAAALALFTALAVSGAFTALTASVERDPTADDGVIEAFAPLSIDDVHHPALSRLDPGLRDALVLAQEAAEDDGIRFDITSGWRSADYQRRLLDDAVLTYGSEEEARAYVATPETSSHVVGQAVDIGSLDAQLWLAARGAEWGLCQTYANERWHFEKATDAGGVCPTQKRDARG